MLHMRGISTRHRTACVSLRFMSVTTALILMYFVLYVGSSDRTQTHTSPVPEGACLKRILTTWNRVLLEKLIATQLGKKLKS